MSSHLVVVDTLKDWRGHYPNVEVVSVSDYLSRPEYLKIKGARVINLCRSYRYLSVGYYCSLLAEARRHKAIPSVRTLTDLASKAIYSLNIEDVDDVVDKSLKKHTPESAQDRFELYIYFGQCDSPALQDLARQIFELFRCPLLKVEFRMQGRWQISSIKPAFINALNDAQSEFFGNAFNAYLSRRWRAPRTRSLSRYDLAILHNPAEAMPPSNPAALKKFIKAGKKLGLDVELIEKKDYPRLAEYDALFIRETTQIDHYTYQFSTRAEGEGMVVIDDPNSIVKCTNKVYLSELLAANKIPRPKTAVLRKGEPVRLGDITGFPVVLKIPDGSFSRGIFKAENDADARQIMERLFKDSDLILAQEFLYTEFDWRIGILNGEPLYACQYFMSRAHWQIVKHSASGRTTEGDTRTWRIDETPPDVVRTALSVAALIGDGLYGVDLKQNSNGLYVIEINDNPSIETGVEDKVLGDELYSRIMGEFVRRLDQRKAR